MVSLLDLPTSTLAYFVLLTAVVAERLAELHLSRRHAAWAFARGGIETGQRQFRWMTVLHGGFLIACAVEVWLWSRPFYPVLGVAMLALLALSQSLRYWAIVSLGPFWNVRVIVVPGALATPRGPYRFVRHPNYVAVALEGLALPLVHSAWLTAIAFTLLNAWMLRNRIRTEEAALVRYSGYGRSLGTVPRFIPQVGKGP